MDHILNQFTSVTSIAAQPRQRYEVTRVIQNGESHGRLGESGRQVLSQDTALHPSLRPGPGVGELYRRGMLLWWSYRYVLIVLLVEMTTTCSYPVLFRCRCSEDVMGGNVDQAVSSFRLLHERAMAFITANGSPLTSNRPCNYGGVWKVGSRGLRQAVRRAHVITSRSNLACRDFEFPMQMLTLIF